MPSSLPLLGVVLGTLGIGLALWEPGPRSMPEPVADDLCVKVLPSTRHLSQIQRREDDRWWGCWLTVTYLNEHTK